MAIELLTALLFGGLIVLLVTGVPLVFALGGIAVAGTYFLWGANALYMVGIRTLDSATSFVLLAVPMFIFMGAMLERSGVARDLYAMMYKWIGPLRGGLASGTVLICAIFAALVGISGAATVAMTIIALPSMLEHGYDKRLAIGVIAGGGALGVLIPPSVLMIVLGLYTNTSIGMLFLGGISAGLLIVLLFLLYIAIACGLRPSLGPALPPEERIGWRDKLIALRAVVLPILIVIGVLGSIVSGAATPSEAAGVGALASIVCAALYRELDWRRLMEACTVTLRLSCMVIWIVFAASLFTALYSAIGAQDLIREALLWLPGGRWAAVVGMQVIWVIMGALLDPIGIMLITAPLFFPIIVQLGFDPVWFGVLFVVNMEMAFLTPPFGFNLFYIRGVAPPGVEMIDIYRSVLPFVLLQATALIILMIFPKIVLWLPDLLLR